jgi:hypothetical protein
VLIIILFCFQNSCLFSGATEPVNKIVFSAYFGRRFFIVFSIKKEYYMVMDILLFLLPILAIVLFGLIDGAQTIRKDCATESIFWKYGIEKWGLIGTYSDSRELREYSIKNKIFTH